MAQIKSFMTAIDPAFASVGVRIIRANQLCSAITMLAPGIALRLNGMAGYDHAVFNDLAFMADCCNLEMDVYQSTEELSRAAEQITRAADGANGFQHVRVLGDAGAGKTHLIYRALSVSKLKGCVLYCRDPEEALTSRPLMALTSMAAHTTIVLVADECSLETAEGLTALFKRRANKMLLVSADNVAEASSAHLNIEVIDVPQLDQPAIAEIFKAYGIPADSANWLATLCAGSPRAAHRLGSYVKLHPDEQPSQHLAHLDGLWDRVVCAPDSVQSAQGQDKLAVIRTLALFRQIAWDTTDGAAAQEAVLTVLKKLDDNFTFRKLVSVVQALREKRVLQGPRTLLISPQLLHIAMWKSWFDLYSPQVDMVELRAGLGGRMQEHFDAMLTYAKESRAATALADRLMGEGGQFASLAGFSTAGSTSLFFAIAQAKPKVALRRFATALGVETVETRKAFMGEARRTAVYGLEQLAVPTDTFFEAADCLLLLAEAENESWSNNSTGIFVSLFGLGHGPLAASELSPAAKIDYLRRLLTSDSSFRRQIAVQALSKSLNPFMSRTVIDEVIGLRRLPDRWQPATYGELFDVYAAHVSLLEGAINTLPPEESITAAKGILDHARSLILIEPLVQTIITFLRRAATLPGLRDASIETVVAILHYEGKGLEATVVSELDDIRIELTESSFSSKLRRRAAMKLIEDNFDAEGNYSDAAGPELVQLAADARATPTLLEPELSWLVTKEAKNGYQFGQLLGQVDDDLALWNSIRSAWIAAGSQRSDLFIGGYLSARYERKVEVWERLVEGLFSNLELRSSLMGVVWRSGMSDNIATALLEMARRGEIDARDFRLLVYGSVINQLPLSVFTRVVDLLLELNDVQAADAALDILDARLRGAPDEINLLSDHIKRMLNASPFVEGAEGAHLNNMLQHSWNEVANRFLAFDVDGAGLLAARCIDHFGDDNSVTSGYRVEPLKFLTNAAREKPDLVWPAIAKRLTMRQRETGTWRMMRWLRDGRSSHGSEDPGLDAIPTSMVFEWIDVEAEDRAWLFAENCPPHISKPDEPPTFARQLLERYGTMERVRCSLHANTSTEGWRGPAGEHYRRRLSALEAHLMIETNGNVRMWLVEHRAQLEHRVEREVELELNESER